MYKSMKKDVVAQAIASLTLGFALARELGHAAFVAANSPGRCKNDVVFWFDCIRENEQYHMLQSLVFGGTLRKEQDKTEDPYYTIDGVKGVPGLWLALSDYPSASFAQTLTFRPGRYRPKEDLVTGYHREWQVPFWWTLKMMSDNVWDVSAVEQGRRALKAPREIGFIMKRNRYTKWGPLHGSMDVPEGVVPHGFKMVPRSYHIAADSLWNEITGDLLYDESDASVESCSEKAVGMAAIVRLKKQLECFSIDSSDCHSEDSTSTSSYVSSGIPCEDRPDEAFAWSEDEDANVWTVSRNGGGFQDDRGTFSDEMLLAAHDVGSDGSLDERWTDASSEEDPLNDLERVVAGEVGDEASEDGYESKELVAAGEADEEMSDDGYHSEDSELIGSTDEQGDGELSDEEDPLDDLNRIANGEADSDSERGDTPMNEDDVNGVTNGESERDSADEVPAQVARKIPNGVNGHK